MNHETSEFVLKIKISEDIADPILAFTIKDI